MKKWYLIDVSWYSLEISEIGNARTQEDRQHAEAALLRAWENKDPAERRHYLDNIADRSGDYGLMIGLAEETEDLQPEDIETGVGIEDLLQTVVRDRETGTVIDYADSPEDARNLVIIHEYDDEQAGNYQEDFYEIALIERR